MSADIRPPSPTELIALLDEAIAARDYGDHPERWERAWNNVIAVRDALKTGSPRLDISGMTEEDWTMLAALNGTQLRAALRMMAKAQAAGDL